jgi:pyruvate dehydrogenase E2 component (dihydrolipoamide acetyltransferase)
MAFEFKFPDVGEGITEGELLSWKVKEGDVVTEDQTLAEVETDKAVVEMPSPRAGRVARLHAEEGETIEVGQVIVTIDDVGPAAQVPLSAVAQTRAPAAPPAAVSAEPVPVGDAEFYTGSVVGELEEAEDEEPVTPAPTPVAVPPRPAVAPSAPQSAPPPPTAVEQEDSETLKVLALPSVRRLAKDLGVDLARVHGTGPGGRILRQDVEDVAEAATYGRITVEAPSVAVHEAEAAEAWMGGSLEQDEHGVIERVTLKGLRRTMARRMHEAVARQAEVTSTEEADVSVLRRIREKERTLAAERGVRLTYLAFVVKACASALKRFPRLNAVLQEECDEFLLKRYYNIGFAVDTKAGLVVPNIKEVDRKSIFAIAAEIVDLADRAQERTLELSEIRGGTFTITNYGAIGGLFATPVTNYPEVAILGMGRVRDVPVARRGEVVVRQLLPLSLTFDHQLIDGAEAARFLNLVVSYLEDPDLLLLESV